MSIRALRFVAWAAGISFASLAYGNVIYTYQGNTFDPSWIVGTAFTADDSVTGLVEFDSQPTPGGSFDASNVVAFSFAAGPVTITQSSLNLDLQDFSFQFDAFGNIQDWNVFVNTLRSDDPDDIYTEIATSTNVMDQPMDVAFIAVVPVTDESIAYRWDLPGTWSVVPEPSTLVLWLLASVAGASVMVWRTRQRS